MYQRDPLLYKWAFSEIHNHPHGPAPLQLRPQVGHQVRAGNEVEAVVQERCHVHTSTLVVHRFGMKVIVEPANH